MAGISAARLRDIEATAWYDHDSAAREAAEAEASSVQRENRSCDLAAGMNDAQVVEIAKRRADLMAEIIPAILDELADMGPVSERAQAQAVGDMAKGLGAVRAPSGRTMEGRLKRAACPIWWARQLKRAVVLLREQEGRSEGHVSARKQHYLTDDSLRRIVGRQQRARAMLETTEIEAADGTVITLAQASDAGTANPVIRRGELMTRIRGCEEWATANDWAGIFTTNTAPSRFHANKAAGGVNQAWTGAGCPTVKDGQKWLCKTWARTRAKLARMGLDVFGVRVAEPHLDGTPHWHMLLWARPEHVKKVCQVLRVYWLKDSRHERGAKQYRFKVEAIDPAKGGAVAYVSKYISKNIDNRGAVQVEGHRDETADGGAVSVEQGELFAGFSRPAMWARAHGIRQFQAIGQPPVTVWRELRRVDEAEAKRAASGRVLDLFAAVNRDGDKRADWCAYMVGQGGACVGRDYLVKLATVEELHEGQYEAEERARPVGVLDTTDNRGFVVRSSRKEWKPRGAWKADGMRAAARHARIREAVTKPQALPTWTRLNNCTQEQPERSPNRGALVLDWWDAYPPKVVEEILSGRGIVKPIENSMGICQPGEGSKLT